MEKNKSIKVRDNGAIVRLHNRRIKIVQDKDGSFVLEFIKKCDKGENPDEPVAIQSSVRGRRVVGFKLSKEALDLISYAYLGYQRQKQIEKQIEPIE